MWPLIVKVLFLMKQVKNNKFLFIIQNTSLSKDVNLSVNEDEIITKKKKKKKGKKRRIFKQRNFFKKSQNYSGIDCWERSGNGTRPQVTLVDQKQQEEQKIISSESPAHVTES